MMRIHISPICTLVLLLPCIACIEDEESVDELRSEAAFEDSLEIASDPGDPLEAIPVDPCDRSFRSIPGECIPEPGTRPRPIPKPKPPRARPPSSEPPPRAVVDPIPQRVLTIDPVVDPGPAQTGCEIVTVDPIVLWPPSHEPEGFSISDCVVALADCGVGEVDFDEALEIVSLSSDEYDYADTIQLTGESSFEVRSERSGGGDGRVYTVGLRYTDADAQHSYASCQVVVPAEHGVAAVDSGCQLCVDAGLDGTDACQDCAYSVD